MLEYFEGHGVTDVVRVFETEVGSRVLCLSNLGPISTNRRTVLETNSYPSV